MIFSQSTASMAATSDVQVPIRKPVTETPHALIGSFADLDDINDDTLECDAIVAQGKGKSKVISHHLIFIPTGPLFVLGSLLN